MIRKWFHISMKCPNCGGVLSVHTTKKVIPNRDSELTGTRLQYQRCASCGLKRKKFLDVFTTR